MAAPQDSGLKKLGPVLDASSYGYTVASNLYTTARAYVPASLESTVEKAETTLTEYTAPLVTRAQDTATAALKLADDKVDQALSQATSVYQANSTYITQTIEKQKQLHAGNLESYKAAREQYLKKVEESVEFLKSNGLTGAARRAADEALAAAAEARKLPLVLVKGVHDAVSRLLALGPVQGAVGAVRPGLETAYGAYSQVHDSVVASERYRRAVEIGQQVVARAEATALYQRARTSVYPLVAPYADPALSAVSASPYFQAAIGHLAPRPAVAAQ